MILWLYISISLLGVYLCHAMSNKYLSTGRENNKFLYLYLVVAVMLGEQHYSLAFNKEVSLFWGLFFNENSISVSDSLSNTGFAFFVLTILTFPPSKLNLLLRVVRRVKQKN